MHILIIPSEEYVPADFPLSGIFQQDQARALKRAGLTAGVITPQLRLPVSWKFARGVFPPGFHADEDQGIPVLRYYGYYIVPRFAGVKMRAWVGSGMRLYNRYIKLHGTPDLVHAHNALYAGILADAIRKKWHVPYVLTEHSSVYAQGLAPVALMPQVQAAFVNASRRIVVSPGLGEILENVVGSSVAGWEWVPNIISRPFEDAVPRDSMWQPGRPFKFFNAAGLVEVKGHEDLLRAFASAFAGDEKVSLRIAGGGSLRDDLEVLVAQQGIGKQVYFLGEISRGDVVEEMLSCDAYVQSSHYETFGLAIIEAFACGKPVVTTCTEGARQFVNEQNGMTVPVKDIPALAGALSWMRSNAGRYDSHSIRELCLLQFGEKAIVNRLTSIYNGVISSSRESSPIR